MTRMSMEDSAPAVVPDDHSEETSFMDADCEVAPRAGESFVVTPEIEAVTRRTLAYLSIGRAVNLAGPAGTGKTTLAFHIASQLNRPCVLLHGDDDFSSSDLIGQNAGYRRSTVVDNYIHSVVRRDENMSMTWVNSQLTTACQEGYVLVYDEFTRSRPHANNPFLSILSEGILTLPASSGSGRFIKVHPEFRAIFTSNPEEYAGVHSTQDALWDRLITIELDHYDRDTEIRIAAAKSELDLDQVGEVVDLVRSIRERHSDTYGPSLRAIIAICRATKFLGCRPSDQDPEFRAICTDVLGHHLRRQGTPGRRPHELKGLFRTTRPTSERARELASTTTSTRRERNSVRSKRTTDDIRARD